MYFHNRSRGGLGSDFEATLFQQAQAGCAASLNRLMTRHDGLEPIRKVQWPER
jgi:hypothetical protein